MPESISHEDPTPPSSENPTEKVALDPKKQLDDVTLKLKDIDERGSLKGDLDDELDKKELENQLKEELISAKSILDTIKKTLNSMVLKKQIGDDYRSLKEQYDLLKKQFDDLNDGDYVLTKEIVYENTDQKQVAKWLDDVRTKEGYDQLIEAFFKAGQILDNSHGKSTESIDKLNNTEVTVFRNKFYQMYQKSPKGFDAYIQNTYKKKTDDVRTLLNKLETTFKNTEVKGHFDRDDVRYGYIADGMLMISSNATVKAREKVPPAYKPTEATRGTTTRGGGATTGSGGTGATTGLWGGGADTIPPPKEKERESFVDFSTFQNGSKKYAYSEVQDPDETGYEMLIYEVVEGAIHVYPLILGTPKNLEDKAKQYERTRKTVGQSTKEILGETTKLVAEVTNNMVLIAANVRTIKDPGPIIGGKGTNGGEGGTQVFSR